MSRKQTGEMPKTVHVWISQIRGSKQESTVYCDRERARRWVCARLGSDGEWRSDDWKDVYHAETETGIVEFATIDDAVGIVIEDETGTTGR